MNRKSIRFLLLAIVALVNLQIVSADKPSKKSSETFYTKKLDYAEVSDCRILDTLVGLINQCKINEPWFDWDDYLYVSTTFYAVDSTYSFKPGHLFTSNSDIKNMFEGKEVSQNIKIVINATNSANGEPFLKYGEFIFEFHRCLYESTKSIFNYTIKRFISQRNKGIYVKMPIISLIYKKSGEIEVLPIYFIERNIAI